MSTRTFRITLVFGLLACGGLGWQWARSHQRERDLAGMVSLIGAENSALGLRLAELRQKAFLLSERKETAVKSQAAVVAEAEAWHARMSSKIAELKNKRLVSPLPKRPPNPPNSGTGEFFPELLGNAEYRSLVRQYLHRSADYYIQRWIPNLAPEVAEKLIDYQVDLRLLESDARVLRTSINPKDAGARRDFDKVTQDEQARIRGEIKTLLGEENYKKYNNPSYSGSSDVSGPGVYAASLIQSALETRLSYSDAPLNSASAAQLSNTISALAVNQRADDYPYSEEVIEKCRSFLSESQIAGLQELRQEKLAYKKRAKLPQTQSQK